MKINLTKLLELKHNPEIDYKNQTTDGSIWIREDDKTSINSPYSFEIEDINGEK